MPNYRYECKNIVEYCFYKAGLKPTKDELEFILDRTKECVSDWHRVYTLFMSIKDDQEFEGTLISL
ncbi:MAG: hypothetical protein NZZ41_07525, partial [Candidatus Dojkabacteria bacterium]|nr:hypothetical protein [Candidatus Dojkabacteria bacterium]